MKRLAILVNVIGPYRVPVYARLAEAFRTLVLHGGDEPNRTWTVELPPTLETRHVFSLKFPVRKRTGVSGVSDTTYVHLNLGLGPWLLSFRPDVIVSNEMGIRTVIALLYGKLMRVPVWVWWGGTLHSERNITESRRRLRRWMVRHVRRWISYGVSTTEYLESIGARREEILEIQNCVPQENFTEAPKEPGNWFADRPRPVLLCVGQLIRRKGVDLLIEACARATARGAEFSLVLVGKGQEQEALRLLAETRGLKHVEILPNQSQATLNAMFRAADVFVFPTLEDIWGLVVNEAMWAGLPVVCSQYAGCAEELVEKESIFDPLSEASFDAVLARALAGTVARPDKARLLTWQQVGDLLVESLESGHPVR